MNTKVGLLHDKKRRLPWLVQWWTLPDEAGKQRRKTKSFKYKSEAVDFQSDKQREVLDGAGLTPAPNITLGELIEAFEKARLAKLSESSKNGYANTFDQLEDHFGESCEVRTIEQRHAEEFMASRKRLDGKNRPLASWTLSQHLKYCRALFGAAMEWGYVTHNPFKPPIGRCTSPLRVKAKSRPWQHFTPAEFVRIVDQASTVQHKAALWLMYGCGLRPGEAYNTTADCIDLEGRRVHVRNRAATADRPPFTVKADNVSAASKERTVPLPAAAISCITEAMAGSFRAGAFLAITPERFAVVRENWKRCRTGEGWAGHGPRPWQNRDMINNAMRNTRQAVSKANIELTAPLTLTTFRKCFGQNHAENGTPLRTLARLMGHSDTAMTAEFYNRVTDANEKAAATVSDRLFTTSAQVQVAEGA